jgi:cell division protein FtsQ
MFALRTVEVSGAPAEVAAQVREALGGLVGESLVALDADDVERRVESLATVLAAEADRDFPHTLRITVRPERPVAVVRRGADSWLVSARGRVMATLEPRQLARLPRIWVPAAVERLAPGTYLLPNEGGLVVRALAQVPEKFPARVSAGRGNADSLVLVLGGKTEVRLGDASELRLKLAVAATVLGSLAASERRELAYLDVSLPTRPVAADKPQVAGSA